MPRLLPDRTDGRAECRVPESTDGNADVLRSDFQFPEHRATASFTEVEMQRASGTARAAVSPVRTSRSHALPGIIGAHTKHRARTALALQAMAGDHKIGVARKRRLQVATCAARHPSAQVETSLWPFRASSIGSVPFQVPHVSTARNRVNEVRSAVCSAL